MAKIYNTKSNTLLSGTSGKDTIKNYSWGDTNVTIDAGAGDDWIENIGDKVTISGGKGNDIVNNEGEEVKISGDAGNDEIYNTFGGSGNGDNATIDGGSGNDTIENTGENVKINGGAGNDSILNYGDNATINGGAGNDKISLDSSVKNNVIQYAEGGGKDTIRGFNSDDTLYITKGSYSTVVSGNDFIVNVGSGKIILKNALADKSNSISIKDSSGKVVTYNDTKVINGSVENNVRSNVTLAGSKKADTIGNSGEKVLITGKAGNDSIRNEGKFVTINAGGGNDTVGNYSGGENATIAGGAGNDSIYNEGTNSTIDGGAGNDTIKNYGYSGDHTGDYYVPHNVSITGGAGNDSIYNEGNYTTIDGGAGDDYIDNEFASGDMYEDMIPSYAEKIAGGAGNDTIKNVNEKATISGGTDDDYISLGSGASNNVIQYAAGDGNDTIIGFNKDDTLQITSGDYTAKVSGKDVIVTVGTGKITLKNAKGKTISIMDSDGNITSKKYTSNSSALFAENNLSEIVAEKSVAEFENYTEKISTENLITFAK